MTSSTPGPTRGHRREGARQRAVAAREAQRRAERRRRSLVQAGVALAVLVIVVGIGIAVQANRNKPTGALVTPASAVDGTGFAVGPATAPVTVEVYEDFQCPVCRDFEKGSGPTLDQLVTQGKVRVVYRPIAILDRASSTNYSTRSLNAAACAADAGAFPRFHNTLYDDQPAEGSAGLSDDRLIDIGRSNGATSASYASCVRDGRYKSWSRSVTEAASKRGVNGTPTVYVNGKALTNPTPEALTTAVKAAGG